MRIGIDVRSAAPTEPGQQRYLWRLGTWLGSEGHDVHFLSLRSQPYDVEAPPSTTLHRFEKLARPELRHRVRGLGLDTLLVDPERARRYRGLRPNVLRAGFGTEHHRQDLNSFRAPAWRRLATAWSATPWVAAERRWERAYYEARDPPPDVVAQSEYMRRLITGCYDLPDGHVHVIPNPVDAAEFSTERRTRLRAMMRRRWGIPAGSTCLLVLGHNYRRKGLWTALRVLPSVLDTGDRVHLLVAGRGRITQRRRARALVRAAGLQRHVTFAGAVQPPIEALAAADALLHLTWHDSFGFAVLEAMATGLPVVTTRFAGAAELVRDGVSGRVVDPEEDAGVARAIRELVDPDVRARRGAEGAALARQHDEPDNFRRILSVMELARSRRLEPVR